MEDLARAEKEQIVIEEKLRLRNRIGLLKSKELDNILREESPLWRREMLLRTLFEVLIGAYIGTMAIIIILFIRALLP
jgi:hypothetical protein